MRRILITLLGLLTVSASMHCYGGFVLTKKINNWNGSLGDKWVKSIINIPICIFVYPITGLIDVVVLNLLEFWTGSNPLAMKEGEIETQLVQKDGHDYMITATANKFSIFEIKQGKAEVPIELTYSPQTGEWSATQAGKVFATDSKSENLLGTVMPGTKVVEIRL
jgi:hypothetical protein